jgi:hypothetical protein
MPPKKRKATKRKPKKNTVRRQRRGGAAATLRELVDRFPRQPSVSDLFAPKIVFANRGNGRLRRGGWETIVENPDAGRIHWGQSYLRNFGG